MAKKTGSKKGKRSRQEKTRAKRSTRTAPAAREQPVQKEPKQPETEDERKAKKNSYVRAWRAAHQEEVRAYMTAWREKKAKGAGKTAAKAAPKAKRETTSVHARPAAEPTPLGAVEAATA